MLFEVIACEDDPETLAFLARAARLGREGVDWTCRIDRAQRRIVIGFRTESLRAQCLGRPALPGEAGPLPLQGDKARAGAE